MEPKYAKRKLAVITTMDARGYTHLMDDAE